MKGLKANIEKRPPGNGLPGGLFLSYFKDLSTQRAKAPETIPSSAYRLWGGFSNSGQNSAVRARSNSASISAEGFSVTRLTTTIARDERTKAGRSS